MERLWTRSFILMILGTFFLFTAFYMLYPTLPLFIKQIGGNETHVGLSMGIFMLSAVVFRPVIGLSGDFWIGLAGDHLLYWGYLSSL